MIIKETHRLAIRKEEAKKRRDRNMDVPVKDEFSFASPFEQLCYLAIGREKFRHDILRVAQSASRVNVWRQIDSDALDIASLELSTRESARSRLAGCAVEPAHGPLTEAA